MYNIKHILEPYFNELKTNLFGNAHSSSLSSKNTDNQIQIARQKILDFFSTDSKKYTVIFQPSVTFGLKTVGEMVPISEKSMFLHLRQNHNSVLGIREFYLAQPHTINKRICVMDESSLEELLLNEKSLDNWKSILCKSGFSKDEPSAKKPIITPSSEEAQNKIVYHLVAFPGEENFSGSKYPVFQYVRLFKRLEEKIFEDFLNKKTENIEKFLVLCDGAAWASGNSVELNDEATKPLPLVQLPKGFIDNPEMEKKFLRTQRILALDGALPDFIVVSFYKMFGFPNLGALLVNSRLFYGENDMAKMTKISKMKGKWRDTYTKAQTSEETPQASVKEFEKLVSETFLDPVPLKKGFFGGGTVVFVETLSKYTKYRPKPYEKYEDGTLPFLQITAIKYGLDFLKKVVGMKNLQDHVWVLTKHAVRRLKQIKHTNGKPIVSIYGNHDLHEAIFDSISKNPKLTEEQLQYLDKLSKTRQGNILSFNVLNELSDPIPNQLIEHEASKRNIHIRSGLLCNPGGFFSAVKIHEKFIGRFFEKKESCGDDSGQQVVKFKDSFFPLGSIRSSYGWMNTIEDVEKFVELIKDVAFANRKKRVEDICTPSEIKETEADLYGFSTTNEPNKFR